MSILTAADFLLSCHAVGATLVESARTAREHPAQLALRTSLTVWKTCAVSSMVITVLVCPSYMQNLYALAVRHTSKYTP